MKILVLSPTPTAPRNFGNRTRIHRVLSHLKSLGHEVHFLHYPAESDWRTRAPLEHLAQMASDWDTATTLPVTRDLHTPPAGEDHTIDEWWDPAIGAYLTWLFQRVDFDIFMVNYPWLSKAFEFAPASVLKVLDTHDKFAGRRQVLESMQIAPEFFYTTEPEEAIAFKRADLVLAIKDEEADYFRGNGARRVDTLIHADLPCFSTKRLDSELKVFGIFAALNNINVSNITRFIETAAPVFRKYLCPLEIHVYGSVCRHLDHLRRFPFVQLKGYVESQAEFYDRVDCVLIPMDTSTGLKIKAAEALSFGKPIIAHRHGFEGLPSYHSSQQLGSFEEIAEACIACVFDDQLLTSMATATKRAQHAAERRFESTLHRMIEARAEVLPKTVFVLDVSDGCEAEEIASAADLARYLSYRYELGVLIVGTLPKDRLEPLMGGNQYVRHVASMVALADSEHAKWIANAERLVTNSSGLLTLFAKHQWKTVFFDARLARSPHVPSALLRKDMRLILLQSTGAVGALGLPPRRPAHKGKVETVSLPRRFWKSHELGPDSGFDYRMLRRSLPEEVLAPELGHSQLNRSASHDAGWAKVWRLIST